MLLFWPIKLAIKIVSLVITAIVVYLIYCGVEVVMASNASEAPAPGSAPLAAIMVLVPAQRSSTPSADLVGRLTEAISLDRAGVAKQIVLVPSDTSLPIPVGVAPLTRNASLNAARSFLAARSLPTGDISAVGGTSTFSALVAATNQLGSNAQVVIVTDAISSYWVSHVAANAGLRVERVYPAIGSKKPFFNQLGSLWRQTTGVAIGRFLGYAHTTWVNS